MPLRRLDALFRRYAAAHLRLSLPGMALTDEAGRPIGQLDRLTLDRTRLRAEGWTLAEQVRLSIGVTGTEAAPGLERTDVLHAHPDLASTKPGFALDLPFGPGRAMLGLALPGRQILHPLPLPSRSRLALARLRLAGPFLRDLTLASPAILRALVSRNPAHRARVKRRLRLADPVQPRCLQPLLYLEDALAPLPLADRRAERARLLPKGLMVHPVTIVLPVYNAFDLLPEVLARVAAHTDLPWHLILIEDASTDARVRPFLRDWAARHPGQVTLIENDRNLGFIRSVNAGLSRARDRGHDVILLNSDAFVPPGWASRLIRPLLVHRNVASVTPLSNDAELLSAPLPGRRRALPNGEADRLDALARQFHPDAVLADLPTGVGFCMAIALDWLKRVPAFDTSFGRGYGEEVDWCRRVRAMGGRHLGHGGVFVEHRGGASFGAEKQALIAAHNAIITRRYPGYDAEVQAALADDPLASPRLALALAWAAGRQAGRMPVYLAHSLGGGAEDWLRSRLAGDLAGAGAAIVLRVGGLRRWQVELHLPEGVIRGATDSFAFVQRLLDPVGARDIRYSCGVGDPHPAELPDRLLALKRAPDDRIEVLFHDYLPISPSYNLLGADGRFHGLPDPQGHDPAHRHRAPNGQETGLRLWQQAWGRLIGAADIITVFSEDSRSRVLAAYPQSGRRLLVSPHRPLVSLPVCPRPASGRPVIGVLGNIGFQKGAAVLADVSRRLAATGAAELVLIGTLDPAHALAPRARIHGRYRREDIPALVARYGIDRWLIPSIWPETFSFATHEALATGLPVWCFDLGAQAEAVRAALAKGADGGVLPLPLGCEAADRILAAILAPEPARYPDRVVA